MIQLTTVILLTINKPIPPRTEKNQLSHFVKVKVMKLQVMVAYGNISFVKWVKMWRMGCSSSCRNYRGSTNDDSDKDGARLTAERFNLNRYSSPRGCPVLCACMRMCVRDQLICDKRCSSWRCHLMTQPAGCLFAYHGRGSCRLYVHCDSHLQLNSSQPSLMIPLEGFRPLAKSKYPKYPVELETIPGRNLPPTLGQDRVQPPQDLLDAHCCCCF